LHPALKQAACGERAAGRRLPPDRLTTAELPREQNLEDNAGGFSHPVRSPLRALIVLWAALTAVAAWADDPPGKVAYERVCAQCHGDDPNDGDDGPALVPMYRTTAQVLDIVRNGTGQMHPLPDSKISDAEVTAVVAWLKMLSQ
jgi:mono/diheme cytochrome c family protein